MDFTDPVYVFAKAAMRSGIFVACKAQASLSLQDPVFGAVSHLSIAFSPLWLKRHLSGTVASRHWSSLGLALILAGFAPSFARFSDC